MKFIKYLFFATVLLVLAGCQSPKSTAFVNSGKVLAPGTYNVYKSEGYTNGSLAWVFWKKEVIKRPSPLLIPYNKNKPQQFVRYDRLTP